MEDLELRSTDYPGVLLMTIGLVKEGQGDRKSRDRQKRRKQCDHRGRDWSDGIKECLKPPGSGKGKERTLSPEPPERE
jgi:hypothetical protein